MPSRPGLPNEAAHPAPWLINVVLVSAAAVVIAAVRVHRERKFEELTAIAEAAQRAALDDVLRHVTGHVPRGHLEDDLALLLLDHTLDPA